MYVGRYIVYMNKKFTKSQFNYGLRSGVFFSIRKIKNKGIGTCKITRIGTYLSYRNCTINSTSLQKCKFANVVSINQKYQQATGNNRLIKLKYELTKKQHRAPAK